MEKIIEEILSDLYALDKDLIQYDKALRKAIEKIIKAKPDTKFDENFKLRLRGELMARAQQLKISAEEKSLKNKVSVLLENFSVALGQFSQSRWALALPMLVLVIGVAFLAQRQYGQNGGVYLTKQNVSFALAPSNSDPAGIESSASFNLKASKDLSVATIKKTVSFKPAVDFSVTKVKKTAMLALPALAAEQANAQDLPYQYEIKPTGELEKGKVYQVAIKNDQIADRDYQWAFQVKAPFGVVEAFPNNKATYVPLNTGIEIQFNRSLPADAEKYFEILPKTEGSFEVKMDKLYFHPKELLEKQIYTITLKKGLISKDDSEALSEDYVFSFETNTKDNQSANEEISFQTSNKIVEATPEMHPMIQLDPIGEGNDKNYEVALYSLVGADDFMQSYKASKNWDAMWSQYTGDKAMDTFKPTEDKKIFSAKGDIVINGASRSYFEVPENLQEGYYFVEIKHKKEREYVWLVVSKVAQYSSLAGNSGLIWAYDFPAKKPLQETEISFIDQDNNEQNLGKLDGEGLLKFALPEALKNSGKDNVGYGPQFFKISANGTMPKVIIANADASQLETGKRYWEKLSTDKNKYRPTDTVNFWGVLKGRGIDIQNEKVQVGIFDCTGAQVELPLIAQEFSISKFDTISGSLKLPELGVGTYCLNIDNQNKTKNYSSTSFEVATYEKPAYQISAETSSKEVFAGQEVTVKVKAAFYDQTPVSKLKLKYSIEDQQLYNWNLSSDEEKNKIENKSGELVLDENGVGELKYTPKKNEKSNFILDHAEFTFEPVMSEEGDISSSSVYVDVFNSTMALDATAEETEKGTFELSTKLSKIDFAKGQIELDSDAYAYGDYYSEGYLPAYFGDPIVEYKASAELVKLTQEKIETGEHYDYLLKTQVKEYSYNQKEETVEKFEGKTDQQGKWKFTKKVENNDPMVSYKVVFKIIDQQGRKFSREAYLYSEPSRYSTQLSINQETFSVGEKIKLHVDEATESESSRPADSRTLFYRFQNDIDQAVVKNGKDFEEDFVESFAPSVRYIGVILTAYGFQETDSVMAAQKQADKKIAIEIKPEKEQYKPGEQVRAQINLKDKDGKPVSTQVNVAVVDEALFQNDDMSSDKNLLENLYVPIYSTSPVSAYTLYIDFREFGGGGGGGEPRSVFLDVPYFQNLETDVNGNALASFKLPDNLTGWRITAKAFDTKTMKAGQAHEIISAGLPFFADVTLNSTYLTGDSPQLKLRFFGKDYDPNQPVEFSIASKDSVIRQTGSTKDATQYLSLGALPKGEYEIQIDARQGEKRDSLLRKIVVKDSYFEKTESRTYQVSQDLKNLKANESGFTKLVFIDKGKGKFFETLSENANGGVARLDQIVATQLANKLLAEKYYQSKFEKDLDTSAFVAAWSDSGITNGGLSLFAGYGGSSLELSAKVADAEANVTDKKQLRKYFNESLYDSKADIHRIAKTLYGLASLGEPVLNKINSVKAYQNELALDDKIYLALALAKSGDLEGARQYYENEIKGAIKVDGEQAWLESGNIPVEPEKLTATLGMLVSDVSDQVMLEKIWNYLANHNPQRDLNVLEKVIIVKDQLAKLSLQEASFKLKTNQRIENISLGKERESAIVMLSREEMNSLSFSEIKGNIEVVSVFDGVGENLQNDPTLKLTRTYKLGEAPTAKFAEGDVIKISLGVQLLAGSNDGVYQLKDILPSGLKPIGSEMNFDSGRIYKQSDNSDWCDATWYPEKIDGNQIYFSFDKKADVANHKCNNFTINYYARVISKGNFKADAAMLQSTENLEKYFVTPTSQLEIK